VFVSICKVVKTIRAHELQQTSICSTLPTYSRSVHGQQRNSVGFPGDRLDAAQRDGALESGAIAGTWKRIRRAYMHAAEFWSERVETDRDLFTAEGFGFCGPLIWINSPASEEQTVPITGAASTL
jgi:hypothetical protein